MSIDSVATLDLDCTAPRRDLRRLHGVNGTGVSGNFWLDLTPWYRRWQIPVTRLHDAPFDAHSTVDLHHLFPDPTADPDDPDNYRFQLTDDLLRHLRTTGTEVYFRLGESIEHQPRLTWNAVDRWEPAVLATVCANIVRHYTQGWADGHQWDITYWEFWNEPHGPKNWNGTPEQFFTRYELVADAVKTVDPSVKIGLAGFGVDVATPDSPWGNGVAKLAANGVPVDFLSWHAYLPDWSALTRGAMAIRRFLDSVGLDHSESHLGEWAYRPVEGHDGKRNIFSAYRTRRYDHVARLTEQMQGHSGLAHIVGALLLLQDLPIDQAHYYVANCAPRWGLFDTDGQPSLRGLAFDIFAALLRRSDQRWSVESSSSQVVATAVPLSQFDGVRVVAANLSGDVDLITLRVRAEHPLAAGRLDIHDAVTRHALLPLSTRYQDDHTEVEIPISGPGVIVLDLHPSAAVGGADVTGHGAAVLDGDW